MIVRVPASSANLGPGFDTLGVALINLGRPAEAPPHFEAALRLDPRYANASLRIIAPSAWGDRRKLTPAIQSQLLAPFRDRDARERVLWALKDGHAQTFRLLQDSVGGITPNTLNTRIKEMREAGFVTHGSDGYCITPTGADLLKRISDLQAFAGKWTALQARKKLP